MSEVEKSPFRVLVEEFLEPIQMTLPTLAAALHVGEVRLRYMLVYNSKFDADLALRLARFFDTSPEFWMHLRVAHNLAIARARAQSLIEAEVKPCHKTMALRSTSVSPYDWGRSADSLADPQGHSAK